MLPKHKRRGKPVGESDGFTQTVDSETWSTQSSHMKSYMCLICGYVYSEAAGDPDAGIAPGTRWEDIPLSWRCPDCGAGKEDFEMVEV